MEDKKISDVTKNAAMLEEERRKRIKDKQKMASLITFPLPCYNSFESLMFLHSLLQYNQIDEDDPTSPTKTKKTTKLVLECDDNNETLIEVHPKIVELLKPHQVEGESPPA